MFGDLPELTSLSGYSKGYCRKQKKQGTWTPLPSCLQCANGLYDGQVFHELYKKMDLSKTEVVAVDAGYKTPGVLAEKIAP